MKKLVLILVVAMLAAPALAAVDFTLADEGGGVVSISYDASGESELPRAFALNITVSSPDGAVITDVTGFKWGESTAASKGFGVFMGAIDYANLVADPTNPARWGEPVADDAGALGGLGTSGITSEMGSLYDAAVPADAPDDAGLLLKVVVDKNCTLTVTANQSRGADTGVRMEDGTEGTTNLPESLLVVIGPACWSFTTQCHGDADGDGDVDTDDWPFFRDGFAKTGAEYEANLCADYDHDGDIDTDDWPEFRDNFAKTPATDCTP